MVAQKIIESMNHMHALEMLARTKSPIHAMDSRTKVVMTCVYLFLVALMPFDSISGVLIMTAYPIGIQVISGLPSKPLLSRVLLVSPFILVMAAGTVMAGSQGTTAFGMQMSSGLALAIGLVVRSFLSLFSVLQLMAVTTVDDFLNGLKRLGLPSLIVLQLGFVIRYLAILMEETASIVRAHTLRSGLSKGITLSEWGSMIGNLFIRTYDRAMRIQQAMKLRS